MKSRSRNRKRPERQQRSFIVEGPTRDELYRRRTRIRNIVQARKVEVAKRVRRRIQSTIGIQKLKEAIRKAGQERRPARRLKGVTLSNAHLVGTSRRRKCLMAKSVRRAVLLARGKVNKAGGAPGPYKKRSKC